MGQASARKGAALVARDGEHRPQRLEDKANIR